MPNLTEKLMSAIVRAKGFVFSPKEIAITREEVASMIDHTLLSPDATNSDIEKLCVEAIRYGFYSVCVNPVNVPLVHKKLSGTPVKIASVVAFPFGATSPSIKSAETRWVLEHGADEIDMVINIGALKEERFEDVYEDIKSVVETAQNKVVKVIIETALLDFDEKVAACVLAKEAGAHFVKTSTGYSKGGAKAEDVALMKFIVGESMEVKASGGIHSFEDAIKMIQAGATRIGASHSVEIVTK